MLTHEALVKALLLRYDFFSAGVVAKELVQKAGLGVQESYEKGDLKKILAALEKLDKRIGPVVAALQGLGETSAPKEKAAPAPAPAAEPEAPAPEAPEPEAAEEAPAAKKKGKK